MAILVHHRSAVWNQELYTATFNGAIPDTSKPPAGLIAHFAGPMASGGWQVIDVWESEDALRAFMETDVARVVQGIQAPPFESTVVDVANSLIP
ncbi:hypothetical protein BLA24_24125 [Streptomyces cinnamoneus]|uniref:ABM domain-containing protein n=1 Tax=Streptomyces cinnamoneus TaxID=53446 RepID=A0A2G1XD21_STRCJ|nr:hypothetical protein [Streptomyces cinnamoneus]PHQ49157.1 hypothetical protein BLA24_24125 [Streptomyces cinnamoneus]PPT15193.1 hypothetical protein CYQ11_21950 [Streptomyces cinnamoneus]